MRDVIGVEDLETAYVIQSINNDLLIQKGARVTGRKIGLTSKVVQAQLGVDQPDFGILLDTMEVLNGDSISMSELMQPKVEAEIAFVLAKDLPNRKISTAELISSIDYALAAIEIVGSRIENWNIKITDTIADNASASHYVLGHRPVKLGDFDVVSCRMEMRREDDDFLGTPSSSGTGAACLGSPINAMLWLANKMAELGTPLKAGEVILSGALGKMVNVEAGHTYTASIDDLGSVSVSFTQ
ncbi:MAG: 2-keto-4-pentenoate hydratase [Saprospiraceae bacterium]|nr:2-keto-4-pentenoate hydratase [Saprospiraceae bacterium]